MESDRVVVAAPFYVFLPALVAMSAQTRKRPKRRDLLVKSLCELFHTRIGTALDNGFDKGEFRCGLQAVKRDSPSLPR